MATDAMTRACNVGAFLGLVLLVFGLLPACVSASLFGSEPGGEERFIDRVASRVDGAREQAQWRLRHNPVRVACPAWEVQVSSVWHRVQLLAGEEADAITWLEEAAKESSVRPVTWLVGGELRDDIEACARGAVLLSLRVDSVPGLHAEHVSSPESDAL